MAAKLTISDIAQLAGVSKATVSRVLNHKPDVDPATRERILHLMDEQGFVPSAAAASLAGGRTRLVGMLVPSLTWPLMPEIMRGVAEAVDSSAYELVLYSINNERDRSPVIDRILATSLTEGLLGVFPGASGTYLADLHRQGFPVVVIDDQNSCGDAPCVTVDNIAGARSAVNHLLDMGHERIGYIQGPASYLCCAERYDGYRQTLAQAGLTVDPSLFVQGDFKPASGHACTRVLLARPQPPTAIFCSNDDMAIGALAAAEELGLRVPKDLSIVGFDDSQLAVHARPPLTTVRQPFFEMGMRAMAGLLDRLDADRALARGVVPRRIPADRAPLQGTLRLPTSLVVRESASHAVPASHAAARVRSRAREARSS